MGNKIACLCDRDHIIKPRTDTNLETEEKNPKIFAYIKKLQVIQRAVKKFLSLKRLVEMKRKEFDTYVVTIGRGATKEEIETRTTTYDSEVIPFKKKGLNSVFWKDPVLLNEDDSIYHGNWSTDFTPKSYGCLYTSCCVKIEGDWNNGQVVGRIYFPFGFSFEGSVIKVNSKYIPDKGQLYYPNANISIRCQFEQYKSKTTILSRANNARHWNSYIIMYPDYSLYDGHINSNNQKNGHGKMYYINGDIYDGEWKNDIYNGSGILFRPIYPSEELDKLIVNEIEHKLGVKYLGYGEYTKGVWNAGYLNGKGILFKGSEMINCIWRHGKVIESRTHKIEKTYELHPNILAFLNIDELTAIATVKNRIMNNYLSNKLLKELVLRKFFGGNKFIRDNFDYITNFYDIVFSNKHNFIPLFGYYTNGGYVYKKFHYSHIFSPVLTDLHYTNFVQEKVNNIIIKAAFNPNSIKPDNTSNYRKLMFTLLNKQVNSNITVDINKLQSLSQIYTDQYSLKDYAMNFHITDINDRHIIDQFDFSKNMSFSLNYIYIDNSYRIGTMKYLTNPLKTLAIYLTNNPDDEITEGHITDENNVNKSINELAESFAKNYSILNTRIENDYSIIEFDSQAQVTCCKLVALIVLNSNDKHVIALRHTYHIGKFFTLKMINQTSLKGFKKTSIDIGTINCYGDFFNIN
jgi:hypothetical protein